MEDITQLSAKEIAKGYKDGSFSAVDVTRAYLKKIESENPKLNAFLEVFDDAEEQAKEADKRLQSGDVHPLTGVPIATKDNILIEGRVASAASKMLENHVATYDATVIKKLRNAGAVFIGRTNMDEFAFGSSTEKSAFGPTRNPHAHEYVPGGTSGGSAAAVAARCIPIALGSDTGGSIRQPASFCGTVGLKPTYGSVSRSGLIAAGSSFDQIGTLARTPDDAELLFETITGHDPKDSTSMSEGSRTYAGTRKKKIGIPEEFLKEGIESEVLDVLERTKETLQGNDYELVPVAMPNIGYSLAAYYILIFAEESTNLSRFDGRRYGLNIEGPKLFDEYVKSRAAGFGEEVIRRVILGTYVLSAGYYDAYYRRADLLRSLILKDFTDAFRSVDAVLMPTSPVLPFKIGEKNSDPLAMYLADIFTVSPNLTGLPAISVPMGVAQKDSVALPVGMQFVGPRLSEFELLEIARDIS